MEISIIVYTFDQCHHKACFFTHSFYNDILPEYTDIDDCQPDSCKNHGTCTDLVNDYKCDCVAGFSGTYCENSKQFK